MSKYKTMITKKLSQLTSIIFFSATTLYCSLATAAEQTITPQAALDQSIQLCNQGNINQCKILADQYLAAREYEEAAKYLQKVCYANSADSLRVCAGLSTLLMNPNYGIEDYKRGMEIATYLCNNNYSYGCNLVSDMFFKGQATETNLDEAFKYGKKSCDLSDSTGCSQAGLVTYTSAYLEKDIAKAEQAFQFYKKACDLGDQTACKEYAEAPNKLDAFKRFVDIANNNVKAQNQAK